MSKKITLYPLIILCCLPFLANAQSYYFGRELQPMPEAVSNNAVCGTEINGKHYLYSFSGIDTSKSDSGIHLRSFKYDIQSQTTAILPSLPDTMGKVAAGANIIGNVAYILGGYHVFPDGHEVSSTSVHRFDLTADTFLTDGAPIPVAIDDHVQAVWNDSLIYVITGWSDGTNVPDVQIYDPANDNWLVGSQTPNLPAYKSFGASGAILNNTIYYFGGAQIGSSFPIQNELRIGKINPNNPTQITWSISIPDVDIAGYRMAAFAADDNIIWLGGSEQTYNYDGISYAGNVPVEPANRILELDTSTLAFTEYDVDSSIIIPMDLRGGYIDRNTFLYVMGGMSNNQMVSNKVIEFNRFYLSVDELETQQAISIYPNPVSAGQTIQLNSFRNRVLNASLISINGQTTEIIANDNELRIPSGISNGIYVLQITGEKGKSWNTRLVIK